MRRSAALVLAAATLVGGLAAPAVAKDGGGGTPSAGPLFAEVAPLAGGVTSDVRRGENAGRKLTHEFVALDLLHAKLEKHGGEWSGKVVLPSKTTAPASALALWVHAENDPAALQAAGGWLQK